MFVLLCKDFISAYFYDFQLRSEVLDTLRKLLTGLGVSSASCHKDIYKCVRTFLVDRSLFVRCSAAKVN